MNTDRGILAEYMDQDTLAAELKCSVRTIYRLRNQRDGLPFVLIGGKPYFNRQSVMKWLTQRETRRNPMRARRAA